MERERGGSIIAWGCGITAWENCWWGRRLCDFGWEDWTVGPNREIGGWQVEGRGERTRQRGKFRREREASVVFFLLC